MLDKEVSDMCNLSKGITEESFAEGFAEGGGNGRGTHYHQNGAAEHDAGKIYGGKWRTFWFGGKILLPLYLAYPQIPRFGDSPHD